jgi:internalin A
MVAVARGVRDVLEEPTLQRVAPEELPALLTRLDNKQTTRLAVIGSRVSLFPSPAHWPEVLRSCVVIRLTGRLRGLPRELFQLERLRVLRLWSLKLDDADADAIARHLCQLTLLDLRSNKVGEAGVRAIAEHLGQLTLLNLTGNPVGKAGTRAIAEHLGQLTSLSLWSNEVGEAGARMIAEHLGQLTSLNLDDSKVGDAGARAIAEHLGQLTSLSLWNNNIGEAGARVIAEHLGQLTSLGLRSNKVGDVGARAIADHLGHLKSLDLDNNRVGDSGVRAIAKHLGQLTSLSLWGNEVSEAGARMIAKHLGQLTSLSLRNNRVGDAGARAIAEHLGRLTSLQLQNNKVGDDGGRAIAMHLGRLTSLGLGYNDVGNEAVAAIGQHLTSLVSLDLESNKRITMVAPLAHLALWRLNIGETGVADLSPLKSLVLSGLPVEWSRWSWKSPGVYVEGCPLTHPSDEVVQRGPEAVLNFFREIEAQGVDRLFEAKLLIVGEGGAGKTSLLRRMFLPEMDLPSEEETTRGIEIHRHVFPMSDGRSFRLNTWDFGGQQIYHATHQFFLTKRSLYVLVDDTRSDHRSIHDEGFKFWLEVIETLSEGSPLLIFQNEKGGRSKQIDEAGIKGRFPNVQMIHRGNLEDPAAADSLRQAVEYFAQRLPHIGEDMPAKWVAIRKDLEDLAESRPYISLEEYFDVYGRHLERDDEKALHLSQHLHDLGVFLHFRQPRELRRTVFLQNQWVTDAVFQILDDEQVKSRRGRFTLTDCDRLWSDRGYADKDMELRAMMVRFELCYRLPDTDKETWLVPQHLSPSKPPDLSDWTRTDDLVLTYRYEFLPRGLVSRLVVRMHRFVKRPDLCWSSGAVFEHGETLVLVETTARGNEIVLRSRGPERNALLSVIASDLDALNDSCQGLRHRVGKWVPCVCDTCAKLQEPAMFEQKELIERKDRGKLTIECPKPPDYADVSVLELLDGMNLEEWLERARQELPPDNGEPTPSVETDSSEPLGGVDVKTVRIFLASSAELREDRDAFDLYFRQQNDRLRKEGLYLEIVRWEDFLDAMSKTRLQDEYNERIRDCDVFVSLFKTKTGKYTAEEFDVAWKRFQATGRPHIYTYFRKATVSTSARHRNDLMSLWDFQEKLGDLGHFYTEYESIDGLQKQFRDQLDKLRADDLL